jgi:protein-S-isoprenylcysteine O-methyltransferase Ste14
VRFRAPRAIARSLLNTAVYGALLLVPAGTVWWWRAWVALGIVFAAMIATRFVFLRDDDRVLAERRLAPIQRGQPRADKLLVVAFLVVYPAYLLFIPVDVFHVHLLAKPLPFVSWLGLLSLAAGCAVIGLAFRENAFAAGIVKYQAERGQAVVDRGVYAVVRHPLYGGVAGVLVGLALWLQSSAAALVSIVPIALLVARIVVEEAFLTAKLPGYADYCERVRHRLIPFVW